VQEFEDTLLKRWRVEKMKESAGLLEDPGWGNPSRDEALEDEREDMRHAREEAELLQQWVPRDVLTVRRGERGCGRRRRGMIVGGSGIGGLLRGWGSGFRSL
jgi:hypothetical protein